MHTVLQDTEWQMIQQIQNLSEDCSVPYILALGIEW